METLVLRNKWHPRIKRDLVAAISEGSPGNFARTQKVSTTPFETTVQKWSHQEIREDAKHLKRGGVAGTGWSDQPV